jgi:hypothetical protein
MNGTRAFLVFSVLVWLPYSILCFFQPSFLGGAAGLVGSTPTGTTELRAMYGGAQMGIGALCAFALMRREFAPSALLMLCFLTGGLGFTRLLGLVIDGSGSAYTFGALSFEIPSTALAVVLLRKHLTAGKAQPT